MPSTKPFYTALLLLVLIAPQVLAVETYHVSVSGAGEHSGSRGNELSLSEALDLATSVDGGLTFLLQPGNYGNVVIDRGYGSSTGGYNRYVADPQTTAPRAADWYEGLLERPDPLNPGNHVIFTGLTFPKYKVPGTDQAAPYYVEVDGINVVDGSVHLRSFVSHVSIKNCNVFGREPTEPYNHYHSERTPQGFDLYHSWAWGPSDFNNITIDSCYVELVGSGVELLGSFGEDVTIKKCHVRDSSGSPFEIRSGSRVGSMILDGNHLEFQNPKADTVGASVQVATVDGSEPRQVFTHSGDAVSATYCDWIDVANSQGKKELRAIAGYDAATKTVRLKSPLSFNIQPGDSVRFWDGNHGSCVSLWAVDNLVLRNSLIHNCGATRGIYFYQKDLKNVLFENNLIYDTLNQYVVDFADNPPKSLTLIGNTFVGQVHRNYSSFHQPVYQYGIAMRTAGVFSAVNNILVGIAGGGADTYDIRGNIVYTGGYQEDQEGPNRSNLAYYHGENYGSEPHPFDGSENFFLGGDDFDQAYQPGHRYNFNRAFRPMITGDACNGTVLAAETAVGALPCACSETSQCREVLGSRYRCVDQSCVAVSYGDVSGDGSITAHDAALTAQAAVELISLTAEQRLNADVTGDGSVSAADAALIAQRAVGYNNKFPVEE